MTSFTRFWFDFLSFSYKNDPSLFECLELRFANSPDNAHVSINANINAKDHANVSISIIASSEMGHNK